MKTNLLALKNKIKSYRSLYKVFLLFTLVRNSKFFLFKKSKKYPKVIQFPIIERCNSRCLMCNIWKINSRNEMGLDDFKKSLSDPLFKKVIAVGINGGEPTLIPYVTEIVEAVTQLPQLISLNIISNFLNQRRVRQLFPSIYAICQDKKIRFDLLTSLDGYKKIHDTVRGVPGAFNRTVATIDMILENKSIFCDNLTVGCTVIKQNVDYLVELDTFARHKNYQIKYRLGVSNKRIASDRNYDTFSVLESQPHRLSATIFFFEQYRVAVTPMEKFKYFAIFYFLSSNQPRRLLGCSWQDEGVTLDDKGNLYYCAVESKCLGNTLEKHGTEIFFDENNINYRKTILETSCTTCIHDYSGKPHISHILVFLKYWVFDKYWTHLYRLKLLWL